MTHRFAFPKAITLDTLDDLFAAHRATFGGFRMEDPPAPTPPAAPTYKAPESQAELDRIIGERLAREREKFADYADLKTKATEYDKALEAAKTEQEKAVEAAKSEGRTEALTAANARLVAAEARALASEAKFRNPKLAVTAISDALKAVKVNDDGTVDADAIKGHLKALSDADPYLVDDGKKPAPKPDSSQGGGGDTDAPSVNRGREMFQARKGPKTA